MPTRVYNPDPPEFPGEDTDDDILNQILQKDIDNDENFYKEINKQKHDTVFKSLNITTETQFTDHLQTKLDKLSQRLKILQIKYLLTM